MNNPSPSVVLLIDNHGFSYYTSYLASGLSKYREILLYGFSMEEYIVTGGIQNKRIKFYCLEDKLPKDSSALAKVARHLLMLPILFHAIKQTNFDIIHFQDRVSMLFLFLPYLKLRRKTICWSLHDINFLPYTKGFRGKAESLFVRIVTQPGILMKYSDKIIVLGSSLRRDLIARGVNKNKIYVIPHFDYHYLLDYEKKNKYKNQIPPTLHSISNEPYALFFGELVPRKGVSVLIDAARIVKSKVGIHKFRLVIAGKAERSNISYFFNSLTSEDYKYIQIYNKWIPNSEIPFIIRNAAFVVLPYTTAFLSTSGVVPLAYTFSKPVIVSNVGSLAEYVDHGKTGFIFEAGDSSELATYIIELVENNSKCLEMGAMAFQKLIREMSLNRCCEMINNLYNNGRNEPAK